VTAVTLEEYNSPRSNRSATNPDNLDLDDDGVEDGDEGFLQRVALQKASLDIDESIAPIEVSTRDRLGNVLTRVMASLCRLHKLGSLLKETRISFKALFKKQRKTP
jgi:hypothetical protein